MIGPTPWWVMARQTGLGFAGFGIGVAAILLSFRLLLGYADHLRPPGFVLGPDSSLLALYPVAVMRPDSQGCQVQYWRQKVARFP
jgi:hypothetical protein